MKALSLFLIISLLLSLPFSPFVSAQTTEESIQKVASPSDGIAHFFDNIFSGIYYFFAGIFAGDDGRLKLDFEQEEKLLLQLAKEDSLGNEDNIAALKEKFIEKENEINEKYGEKLKTAFIDPKISAIIDSHKTALKIIGEKLSEKTKLRLSAQMKRLVLPEQAAKPSAALNKTIQTPKEDKVEFICKQRTFSTREECIAALPPCENCHTLQCNPGEICVEDKIASDEQLISKEGMKTLTINSICTAAPRCIMDQTPPPEYEPLPENNSITPEPDAPKLQVPLTLPFEGDLDAQTEYSIGQLKVAINSITTIGNEAVASVQIMGGEDGTRIEMLKRDSILITSGVQFKVKYILLSSQGISVANMKIIQKPARIPVEMELPFEGIIEEARDYNLTIQTYDANENLEKSSIGILSLEDGSASEDEAILILQPSGENAKKTAITPRKPLVLDEKLKLNFNAQDFGGSSERILINASIFVTPFDRKKVAAAVPLEMTLDNETDLVFPEGIALMLLAVPGFALFQTKNAATGQPLENALNVPAGGEAIFGFGKYHLNILEAAKTPAIKTARIMIQNATEALHFFDVPGKGVISGNHQARTNDVTFSIKAMEVEAGKIMTTIAAKKGGQTSEYAFDSLADSSQSILNSFHLYLDRSYMPGATDTKTIEFQTTNETPISVPIDNLQVQSGKIIFLPNGRTIKISNVDVPLNELGFVEIEICNWQLESMHPAPISITGETSANIDGYRISVTSIDGETKEARLAITRETA